MPKFLVDTFSKKIQVISLWYKLKSDLHLSNKVAQTIAHRIFMREVPSSNPVFANLASFIQNFKIYSKYVILELTKHGQGIYTQYRTGGRLSIKLISYRWTMETHELTLTWKNPPEPNLYRTGLLTWCPGGAPSSNGTPIQPCNDINEVRNEGPRIGDPVSLTPGAGLFFYHQKTESVFSFRSPPRLF